MTTSGGDRDPDNGLRRHAEVALAAITASAVLGLARLFDSGSFILPVLAFALGAHGLAAACRRRERSGWATAALSVTALVLGVSWLLLPHTTFYGVPTTATLAEAGERLSDAWTTFTVVVAPAPVEPGFVLAAAVGVWVLAFAADGAAFRGGAVVEAAVPAATLFVFAAALGSDSYRLLTTAVFLVAVLAYWLAQRSLVQSRNPTWMASDNRMGSSSLLRAGAGVGLLGVTAALLAGPALPGAGADAVIPWRASDRSGPGDRVTVSPLVDIRARLVDQADNEVFTVRSPERWYWRLTSLETFDGRIWRSASSFRNAEGELEPDEGRDGGDGRAGAVVEQEYTIEALSAIWLPAAYRPLEVDGVDAGYDADSSTLITRDETSDGQRYTVRSLLGAPTEEELRAASRSPQGEVDAVYFELPADFPPFVVHEAARVTAGATTPFEQAKALQDHLRSEEFTYDLEIGPGHGGDDLEAFLFETRRGYCEQFAGAYAAMARAVGLPARVAVGFTPGELDGEGRFHVRGSNGHAWPEVFFAGVGWVPFEPTPGRGIPGAERYTGVPFAQAGPDGVGATTVPATTTTTAGDGSVVAPVPSPFGEGGVPTSALGDEPSPWPRRLVTGVAALVGGTVLWAVGLGLGARLRRARRRTRARTPEARVLVAWEEVGEALARAGTAASPSETATEYARRAAGANGDLDGGRLAALAQATTAAGYAPGALQEDVADDALAAAAALERAAGRRLDPRARLRSLFDPRPLLPRRSNRIDIRDEELTGSR